MNFDEWKQRREELMHEARQNQLAKELRASHKRRKAGRAPSPAWEIRRQAGRIRKFLRSLTKTDDKRKEMSDE